MPIDDATRAQLAQSFQSTTDGPPRRWDLHQHLEVGNWAQAAEYVALKLTGMPWKFRRDTFFRLLTFGLEHPEESLVSDLVMQFRVMDPRGEDNMVPALIRDTVDAIVARPSACTEQTVDALYLWAFRTDEKQQIERFLGMALLPSEALLSRHYQPFTPQEREIVRETAMKAAALRLRDDLVMESASQQAPASRGL